MKLLQYRQENEVQSEVEALAAVISPIFVYTVAVMEIVVFVSNMQYMTQS